MKATIVVMAALAGIMASAHQAQATGLIGDFNSDGWVGHLDLDGVLADWEDWPGYADDDEPQCRQDLNDILADWGQGIPLAVAPTAGLGLTIAPVDNSAALTG